MFYGFNGPSGTTTDDSSATFPFTTVLMGHDCVTVEPLTHTPARLVTCPTATCDAEPTDNVSPDIEKDPKAKSQDGSG